MVLFLLIVFLVLLFFTLESNTGPTYSPNLNKDGLILMDRPTADQVLEQLPEGYKFLNYRYTIEGCTLSTFHRDVTSSQYIFETKHPVYTFITYEYDGPALSVCPGSHRTTPFLINRPVVVNANSVLFNCDVVHAGSLNLDKNQEELFNTK